MNLLGDHTDPEKFYKFCQVVLSGVVCQRCFSVKETLWKGKNRHCIDCGKRVSGHGLRPIPHLELAEWFCTSFPGDKTMLLLPRGSYKSTLIVKCGIIWRLIHDPNARVLIDSETNKLSQKTLQEIKEIFESEHFKFFFGDWHSGSNNWTKESITVTRRTERRRESSIECSGIDKAKTGFHYDLIFCDDLVGETNVGSEDMRQKVKDHYVALTPLGDPHCEYYVVGTFWHMDDVYSWVNREQSQSWRILIKAADQGNRQTYESQRRLIGWYDETFEAWGDYYFPEVLSPEFLREQRILEGDEFYAKQYRNSPINPKKSLGQCSGYFKESDDLPPMRIGMGIDPGGWGTRSRSHTGFSVVGIDESRTYYVLEAFGKQMDPDELIDTFFKLQYKYKEAGTPISFTHIERVGTDASYNNIVRAMQVRSDYFNVEESRPAPKLHKEDRIRYTLQPIYKRANVLHAAHLRASEYENQLSFFGSTDRDDIVDASEKIFGELKPRRVREALQELKLNPMGMTASSYMDYIKLNGMHGKKKTGVVFDKKYRRKSYAVH